MLRRAFASDWRYKLYNAKIEIIGISLVVVDLVFEDDWLELSVLSVWNGSMCHFIRNVHNYDITVKKKYGKMVVDE